MDEKEKSLEGEKKTFDRYAFYASYIKERNKMLVLMALGFSLFPIVVLVMWILENAG